MVHFRVTYFLLLCLFAVLVVECTSPHSAVNGTSITTINVTKVPKILVNEPITTVSTIPTQCLAGKNMTPCITINPIVDHVLGDVIKINGTTNRDKGEIEIWIKDANFIPGCHGPGPSDNPCNCCDGVTLTAPIIPGINGNNTWSGEVNTSQHNFYPGKFYLIVEFPHLVLEPPVYESLNILDAPHQQNLPSENTTVNTGALA